MKMEPSECAYEWNPAEVEEEEGVVAIDANGNKLADGDTVTLIKDLKVKGAPKDLKQGTRVKNIRIVEGDHNIDCKIDGFGAMKLKSEFVKKIERTVHKLIELFKFIMELSAVREVLETVLIQVLGSFETLGSKLSHGTS